MSKQSLRRIIAGVILTALLCLAAFGSGVLAVQSGTVTSNMNFRSTPGGAQIGSIGSGSSVVLNYTSGEWDNVTYNGRTGWIHTGNIKANDNQMRVVVVSGYLALRTAREYSSTNEIGKLYTGDHVEVLDTSDTGYWWVYSASQNKSGYVNKDYLVYDSLEGAPTMTVRVQSGYLALRNGKAYDVSNETGKLYTGDTVQVTDTRDNQYWFVYAPSLKKYGYVNKDYLSGGNSGNTVNPTPNGNTSGTPMTVKVDSGYLALRTAKAFDYSNEIGSLYTGDTVYVQDTSDSTYWWVYSPKIGRSGYVNRNYLVGNNNNNNNNNNNTSGTAMYVSVNSGYLALRTAKAFDYSNEIGALYNGSVVYVQDTSDPTYWWVYAPSLGSSGYVNRNYLVNSYNNNNNSNNSGFTMTVYVQSGYLALRNAQAFDYSNEIGKLYSGDTVRVQDTSGGQYWWVYAPSLGKSGYVNSDYLY